MLTSAEAVSAALFILGDREGAAAMVSKMKWGPNFLVLNRELLRAYASAATAADVEAVERGTFGRDRNLEMVPA